MAKVKLYMGSPIKGDYGIARLSTKAIAELKAKEGDLVTLTQGLGGALMGSGAFAPRFKIAKAVPGDEAKNIIRVGEVDFNKQKYKADAKTTVTTVL